MARPLTRAVALLLPLAALSACTASSAQTTIATGDAPAVTGAVQVNGDPGVVRAHMTPLIARNPTNGELVIAEVDGRSATRECNVYLSVDDGRSWFKGGGFMVKPFTDCSIGAEYGATAVPFFDAEGVLYVAFAANDPARLLDSSRPISTADLREDIPRNAYLARSADGGRTFTTNLVAAGKEGSTQTAYFSAPSGAIDPTDPRYIYVGWGQGDWSNQTDPIRAMVSASSDGGKTWSAPVDVADRKGADYSSITVGSKGTVHAVYWSREVGTEPADPAQARPGARKIPTPIYHVSSADHGKTWTREVLDPGNQRLYRPPVIVADRNSQNVYVAWNGLADPNNFITNRDAKDRVDIFLRASTDNGKTWTDRRIVNDDPNSGVNHELPGIAVAPNGRVDVAWYDYRHSPRTGGSPGNDPGLQDVYYAFSNDAGRTWSPNLRITDRSIDRSIGVYINPVGGTFNVGITSTDDTVYFAWQDSRNGRPDTMTEDIYSASLRFDQSSIVVGGGSAADSDTNGWAILGAGVVLGAGLAMVAVWALGRGRDKPVGASARS
ncbi:MAG: sialidase family protein [Acidimicrobiales bacterium]